MSMMMKNKPKSRTWQALTLAALVLAGGSIATPQSADAATSVSATKSLTCDIGYKYCNYTVQVYKRQANSRFIYFNSPLFNTAGIRYAVVDLTHSKVRCTGKIGTSGGFLCQIPNRTARLQIRFVKAQFQAIAMNAEIH